MQNDSSHSLAGKPATEAMLIDVQKLISLYYDQVPDPSIAAQRVKFGTSGHRGTSLNNSFNEAHILAISQAICLYRKGNGIRGPLFLGIDTHALSIPAYSSALEVFAANGVEVLIAKDEEYTPTPVISHAILVYNQHQNDKPLANRILADGVVITPSHDPPHDGGFKYNPPNGGPANLKITDWIEKKANEILENKLKDVKRVSFISALRAATTHQHDYVSHYVNDLENVIDFSIIRDSNIHMGVDPMGGAGVHYWPKIAERYHLNMTITNTSVDPTFRFMTLDWDNQIRMDPSSPYAMQNLIALKDNFDIAFACDTDHDRHGIVTPTEGLMPSNHYLSVAVYYLFQHREQWNSKVGVGKTIVSSEMINRVSRSLKRNVYEVPVGFKWFVDGLLEGNLGFCGEESAGASFNRKNGKVWSTDKDGIISALLAAEMTAKLDQNPSEIYKEIEKREGKCYFQRIDAHATAKQKELLKNLSKNNIRATLLAGDKIQTIENHASGNDAPIGGIKISTQYGWFAARPSGTEDIYRLYAESFKSKEHLQTILHDAQQIISESFGESS